MMLESANAFAVTVMFVSLGHVEFWISNIWLQTPSTHEEEVMVAEPHIMLVLSELI